MTLSKNYLGCDSWLPEPSLAVSRWIISIVMAVLLLDGVCLAGDTAESEAAQRELEALDVPKMIGEYELRVKRVQQGLHAIGPLLTRSARGVQCRIRYSSSAGREIEGTISRFLAPAHFKHHILGLYLPNEKARSVRTLQGQTVLAATRGEDYGLMWYDDKGTAVTLLIEGRKEFPSDVADVFLKIVPSAVSDPIGVTYDQWCRDEIGYQIAQLQEVNWNELKSADLATDRRWDKVRRPLEIIGNLTMPTSKEDVQYQDFSTFLISKFGDYGDLQKKPVEEIVRDVEEVSKWWKQNKETFKAGRRRHKRVG